MVKWNVTDPEMESVEEFAEYLMDEERSTFTNHEVLILARSTKQDVASVRAELGTYGFNQVGHAG